MLSIPGWSARLLRPAFVTVAVAALPLVVAAPASAAPLPGRTITGELVQAYPESAGTAAPATAPLTWVQPASGDPVRVDTADVEGVPSGSTVRLTVGGAVDDGTDGYGTSHSVTGDVVVTHAAASTPASVTTTTTDSGSSTTQPAAPAVRAVPVPPGTTDRVTVVLVKAGGGSSDGTTAQDLTRAVDGDVRDFWAGQTAGRVRFGVAATLDWTATAGCAEPTKLWDDAAKAAGFVDAPGNHLLVYVSSKSTDVARCAYGLAEVGSGIGSGGRLYVEDTLPSLLAHELGHNLGLGHSSERECDGTLETGACQTQPYRDYYDVMGASWEHVGSLNAAQAARLGVLPVSAQQSFASDRVGVGSATLAPLSGTAGTRAVRLVDAAGADYWLEYRTSSGQDDWLDTDDNRFDLQGGVLLHRSGDLPDTSLLLDASPSHTAGWDGDLQVALPVGTPVTVAGGQFTVTVQSLSGAGAVLRIATAPAAGLAPAAGRSVHVLPGRKHTAAQPAPADAGAAPSEDSAVVPAPLADAQAAGSAPARSLATTSASRPTGLGSTPWFAAGGVGGLLLLTTAALRRRLRR